MNVNFHLPGAASARRRDAEDLRQRQVFVSLPRDLAAALQEAARTGPKPATPSSGSSRAAETELVTSWIGDENVRVRLLGAKGGVVLTYGSADAAAAAIARGVLLRRLGLRVKARELLPREEVDLAWCARCAGYAHTAGRCPNEPRCRTCGESGHSEVRGECPKKKGSGVSVPAVPHCISCGHDGHKHGAPSCPDYQAARRALVPRPGTGRVQDRVREVLHLSTPQVSTEHSVPTDQVARSFLEVAARGTDRMRAKNTVQRPVPRAADPMDLSDDDEAGPSTCPPPPTPRAAPGKPTNSGSTGNGHIYGVAGQIVSDLRVVCERLEPEAGGTESVSNTDVIAALKLAVLSITELMHVIASMHPPQQVLTYAGVVAGSALGRP